MLHKLEGVKSLEDDHEGENRLKRSVIPIASARQTIELKGTAAKIRVHATSPEIFVDVENDEGVIEGGYFRIVRLERKREMRVVAENKIGLGGSESSKETLLHSRAERFSGDWWKVIPLEELTPGEYAVVTRRHQGRGEWVGVGLWGGPVEVQIQNIARAMARATTTTPHLLKTADMGHPRCHRNL